MRVRWLVSVAAGAVVLAGAATVVAVSVHSGSGQFHHRHPPVITASDLGRRAVNGVIAAGTVNGKAWRIKLVKKPSDYSPCWSRPGSGFAPNADCLEPVGRLLKHWETFSGPADVLSFDPVLFGPVRPEVNRVSLRLSDGVVLILHPVEAFGHKWIGIVMPAGLAPVKAVAYARDRELAHSVPFDDNVGGRNFDFMSWLPAGDDGPSRMTKVIRGGGLKLVLHTGPWGNCLSNESEGYSFPLGFHPNGALEGTYGLPRTVPMAFPWPARYMTLDMSDGSKRHVKLVQGAGLAFAIIRAPRNPSINDWNVFDGRGHRLSGGVGAPGGI
ncbi:MAG TPA: hypothetical protein VJT16_03620 [Streptosporangiaceae bacterium]|nr:hypothetical protein [Streptosporangiaceae bacterium]